MVSNNRPERPSEQGNGMPNKKLIRVFVQTRPLYTDGASRGICLRLAIFFLLTNAKMPIYDSDFEKGEIFSNEFTRVQETTTNDLALRSLSGAIHPVFYGLLMVPQLQFSVVQQSAILASHYLESGVLDHVIATISNEGKPGRLFQAKDGEKDHEIPLSSSPSGRAKVQVVLSKLAETLNFRLDATIVGDAETETVQDPSYFDSMFPNGVKSIIKVSNAKYNRLRDAVQAPVTDVPLILYLQMDFANTLVHEIGHAVDNLSHGKLHGAIYLGDSFFSEPGFEIEAQLFGGRLAVLYGDNPNPYYWSFHTHNSVPSNLVGIIVLWEYPYQGIVTDYRHGGGLGIRDEPKTARQFDVAWRVPITFLQRLFDDSFWQMDLPSIRS